MRKPNKIKIHINGRDEWLDPFHLPFSEILRVLSWLNRVNKWKLEQAFKKRHGVKK